LSWRAWVFPPVYDPAARRPNGVTIPPSLDLGLPKVISHESSSQTRR
jgi:hypothetical protein